MVGPACSEKSCKRSVLDAKDSPLSIVPDPLSLTLNMKKEVVMARVYNELKTQYEGDGYMPFVGIIEWPSESEPAAIERYIQVFNTPEGQGVKGVHTWRLIGRPMMVAIGWTNSQISLQKFYSAVTLGTDIIMELNLAIDHEDLITALQAFEKRAGTKRRSSKK